MIFAVHRGDAGGQGRLESVNGPLGHNSMLPGTDGNGPFDNAVFSRITQRLPVIIPGIDAYVHSLHGLPEDIPNGHADAVLVHGGKEEIALAVRLSRLVAQGNPDARIVTAL